MCKKIFEASLFRDDFSCSECIMIDFLWMVMKFSSRNLQMTINGKSFLISFDMTLLCQSPRHCSFEINLSFSFYLDLNDALLNSRMPTKPLVTSQIMSLGLFGLLHPQSTSLHFHKRVPIDFECSPSGLGAWYASLKFNDDSDNFRTAYNTRCEFHTSMY
jgi:hypothetical protein